MKKNIILSAALMLFGLTAQAQTTISFDSEDKDYKAIGVYDAWEESPFRAENPTISSEAAVVDNPDTKVDEVMGVAPNNTEKVVKLCRSRYGSNTFGVRIDLKEPIRMTKQLQYIHIMTYLKDKPADSRMMVIGLGKRLEESWNWQTGEDEQFWAVTNTKVKAKEGWQDVVVSFKGFSYSKEENANSGIDIYSLVIVPDVRSPHADTQDWYAYFDEIVVDNNPEKRFSTDKYALTYEKDADRTRNDRKLNGVGLNSTFGEQTSAATNKVYSDNTTLGVFSAKAGEEVQPTFNYTGGWMSGYIYVDWNNDGKFEYGVNANGTPAAGSEIVSYSAAQIDGTWYKSDGTTRGDGNAIGSPMPKFTIPAGTPAGLYRMRYKVDWDNLNPAGGSTIISDGGGYVDVMLDVHDVQVTVNASQLNGDIVLAEDERALQNYVTNYGALLTVKDVPAPGFVQYGFLLKYGYNVNAATQLDDNGNPNWIEVNVPYTAIAGDGTYTIPAEYMRGAQVSIKGDMQQEQLYTVTVEGLEGQGGVVYANIETQDGGTVRATQFFSVEQVAPMTVEGYTGSIRLEDRNIIVTYAIAAEPYTQVAALSEVKNYKLYQIAAKSGEGYWAFNNSITEEFVSLRGVTNTSYNLPNDETVASIYQEAIDPFDATIVWQILQEDGKIYLYQPERKAYVTRNGRDYKFTETKTALDAIRENTDDYAGTFGIHAGGDYSDGSTNFACIVTNEAQAAVRNWTWNDHGSVLWIIENPNVYTAEYAVEVIGATEGGIVFEGTEYANGATFTSTEFLTAEDVAAKEVGRYTSTVTLDKENAKVIVEYVAPTVVTAINPKMFYTLECRSDNAHNTARFIGDNGTVINGQSAEPTYLMFEPGETEGTYYIKSMVSGKYINSDGEQVTASTQKATAWTFGVGGKDNVANLVTFGISGDKYLNNNGTKSDGSCVNLQPNSHAGGPGNTNACSLWEMCEFQPDYNNYLLTVLGDATAAVTYNGEEYANGETIETLEFIQSEDLFVPEVAGKMIVVNIDGMNIYVSYVNKDTKFYTLKHSSNAYVSLDAGYTDGNGNMKLTNKEAVENTKGLWAFEKQSDGGYKIYNFTTGLAKVLGMTGSEGGARASMVSPDNTTHTTTFYKDIDSENEDISYFKLSSDGNNYWNYRDEFLALWNHSAALGNSGSQFYITEVDFEDYLTPEVVTINEIGLATFYANSPATIAEGVKAYVATEAPVMENGVGIITMTEIADGIVPAQTGVVICGKEGDYAFEYTSQMGTPVDGNLLRGYAGVAEYAEVEVPTDGSTNYVLTIEGEQEGFYKKESGFKVYNHKAYLNVPEASGAMKAIRLRFENNDGTTSILEIPTEGVNANSKYYDLSGRRVEKATKGMYIVNGKKVIF